MGTAQPRRTWVEQIMGLPVSVLARGGGAGAPEADAAVLRLFALLHDVDRRFSPYLEDSDVGRIQRGELELADAEPEVIEVDARCRAAVELTEGLFDPVTPTGRWDPSGLVKGWAAERAFGLLDAAAVDWCLNVGGDVLVRSLSGEPFQVGIQDPCDAQRVCATVGLNAGAVATSGTAARGAHLYDPRSRGTAAPTWLSVSVTGPSLETADILATAAYVAGPSWLETLGRAPGYAGLAINGDGEQCASANWPGKTPVSS
ncbi:MAG: FAD:protein FMN transferase [Mycobacteriales bacterium]